ncbi:MAG: superoxide dismutase [Chloroflexaceae bacterium]
MKILVLMDLTPGTRPEDLGPYLREEAARAWELYAAGIFRDMNFRTDRLGVVNTLECAGVEEAREILNTLPLAKAGFLQFEIIPLSYPAFLENLWVAPAEVSHAD